MHVILVAKFGVICYMVLENKYSFPEAGSEALHAVSFPELATQSIQRPGMFI